jgi:hypothetical protein
VVSPAASHARGSQARYSDPAIEFVLMLRLVFHLALRQAEGFVSSVFRSLRLALPIPDHTTLSRRSRGFAHRRPHSVPYGPLHLLIDSTGLKLFGRGEWNSERPGRARRSWRKLHLAIDAGTGEIVASVLAEPRRVRRKLVGLSPMRPLARPQAGRSRLPRLQLAARCRWTRAGGGC